MENCLYRRDVCKQNTVEPAHVVTSIKQSSVLKGHIFLSYHKKFHMN